MKNNNSTSNKTLDASLCGDALQTFSFENQILGQNTTLCYIEKDNKYLMLHRIKKENDVNKDKWIGIGGKMENGEAPHECNYREVFEETGLTLNNAEYRGLVTFVNIEDKSLYYEYMHLFWSNDFSGELKECDEGLLEWVPKNKMNSLPHWEGDEIFLKLLDSEKKFFSLKLEYKKGQLVKAHLY